MAYRPEVAPVQVITNGDMSKDITSKVTIIQKISMMSYSYKWAATSPDGTISIQVSNDYSLNPDGTVKNSGTWETITVNQGGTPTTTLTVSGNSGTGFVDIDQLGAYAIRTIYTYSSGTGTLQAWFVGKVA